VSQTRNSKFNFVQPVIYLFTITGVARFSVKYFSIKILMSLA